MPSLYFINWEVTNQKKKKKSLNEINSKYTYTHIKAVNHKLQTEYQYKPGK